MMHKGVILKIQKREKKTSDNLKIKKLIGKKVLIR